MDSRMFLLKQFLKQIIFWIVEENSGNKPVAFNRRGKGNLKK